MHEPTRGEYLLDLCLSNSGMTQVSVGSKIADHACLLVKEPDAMETRTFASRKIWKVDDANWSAIKSYIAEFDWQRSKQDSIDDVLSLFLFVIDEQKHIPQISKSVEKSCLPWLTDK